MPPQHQDKPSQATSSSSSSSSHPFPSEPIPQLISLAPAIFVPITKDLTTPLPKTSHTTHLQARLTAHDDHALAVHSNLETLLIREHVRILQSGTNMAAQARATNTHPEDLKPGMDGEDMGSMITNMRTPHVPGTDYNITNIAAPDFSKAPMRTPREWTACHVMNQANSAAAELELYEMHVRKTREAYEAALKKARVEEAG